MDAQLAETFGESRICIPKSQLAMCTACLKGFSLLNWGEGGGQGGWEWEEKVDKLQSISSSNSHHQGPSYDTTYRCISKEKLCRLFGQGKSFERKGNYSTFCFEQLISQPKAPSCKVHVTEFRHWFSFLLNYIFRPKICGSFCGVPDITNLIENVQLPRQSLYQGVRETTKWTSKAKCREALNPCEEDIYPTPCIALNMCERWPL